MLKAIPTADNVAVKKRAVRPELKKRAHSISPAPPRAVATAFGSKTTERRCRSLSSSIEPSERSIPSNTLSKVHGTVTRSEVLSHKTNTKGENQSLTKESMASVTEKDSVLPHCLKTKTMRVLATKKREFAKLRKMVVNQQNLLLEQFAAVKELEARIGMTSDNATSEIRILSLTGWPAHDLLLLVRDDLEMGLNAEISGVFGPQVLQQLHAQLSPIPDEVSGIAAEIMSRRLDLLNLLRGKHRTDRSNYNNNLEWKTKNTELDLETERLHADVCSIVENLKKKIEYSLNLAKTSWIDRETLIKKVDKMYKDNMIVQHKLEELLEKPHEEAPPVVTQEIAPNYLLISEELAKEKAAREALKEVVTSAEGMLRVARARISTLERQLKDAKTELDATKKKQKDLEQNYRHRETSYDARSKKLLEMTKNGEIAVETLSRQRDALELRVKELREQSESADQRAESRENEQKVRVELLQAKVAQQEKLKKLTDTKVVELEDRIKDLEEQNQALRERAFRLVDTERRRCLEYVPSKEIEPSDRETEIWKELQVTRMAMSRAEEELRQSRADKDRFLNSLSRIAQEDPDSFKDKMAIELLDREQRIVKLQHVIEEQRDNEKSMEQSMTQYENQLAALRLEVRRLRNYDCYAKEIPNQELQTELLDLQMQVETLSRERSALVSAAASRALMLERHERAAELFAKMIRARRNLAALLDDRTEPPHMDEVTRAEVSRSLSCVCANAADTWTALRVERTRVLQLESAVVSQNLQLQRENMVRTQLERRRAMLERQLMFTQADPLPAFEKNPIEDFMVD